MFMIQIHCKCIYSNIFFLMNGNVSRHKCIGMKFEPLTKWKAEKLTLTQVQSLKTCVYIFVNKDMYIVEWGICYNLYNLWIHYIESMQSILLCTFDIPMQITATYIVLQVGDINVHFVWGVTLQLNSVSLKVLRNRTILLSVFAKHIQ